MGVVIFACRRTDKPSMKVALLILCFTPSAFASEDLNFLKGLLIDAAAKAGNIPSVARSAGRASADCPENIKHLNRPVLTPDPKVPVKICVPDGNGPGPDSALNVDELISTYKMRLIPDASIKSSREFRLFMREFGKFPKSLLDEMRSAGGQIHLIVGDGVTADPTWETERLRSVAQARAYRLHYEGLADKRGLTPPVSEEEINRGYLQTTEGGRNWTYVSGAGGSFQDLAFIKPTRIVINHLYRSKFQLPDGTVEERDQGATNLFLHEHAHALDNMYGPHTISSSPEWKAVLSNPAVKTFTKKIFSSYEDSYEEEGFAEAFSYFHSCEASRKQMEEHAPALADFFKRLTSVKNLRPDAFRRWREFNHK